MRCSLGFSFPWQIPELLEVSQDNSQFGLFVHMTVIGLANNLKKLFDSSIHRDTEIWCFMHSTTSIQGFWFSSYIAPLFEFLPLLSLWTAVIWVGMVEKTPPRDYILLKPCFNHKELQKLVLLQSFCRVPSCTVHQNYPVNILIFLRSSYWVWILLLVLSSYSSFWDLILGCWTLWHSSYD